MELYQKAFKAYDIRGIYGTEIDASFAYFLWKAVGKYLFTKYKQPSFLLAYDVRHQNAELISHFIGGMQEVGVNHITVAGMYSTPTLYYLAHNDFDLAVSITASHNPSEYVGMKFVDRNVELMPTAFLQELFNKEYSSDLPIISFSPVEDQFSILITEKITKLTDFLLSKWNMLTKKYKFVVDFSSGAGVSFEKDFFHQLVDKHQIIFINDQPDGTFSAHESDTSDEANYAQLVQKVQESGADFGVMFDGDADRIGIVSNTGEIVKGDLLTAIIAQQLLKHGGAGEVFYDVMSTKLIEQLVRNTGWTAIRTRTGRYFINRELNERGGLFAGEVSGHYMFKEVGGYEMPLLAIFYILLALEKFPNLGALLQTLQTTFKTPIISVKVEDKERFLVQVKEIFKEYKQDFLDGISVYGEDFWLNVRVSNTEHKIRYTIEAESKEKMKEVQEKLAQI